MLNKSEVRKYFNSWLAKTARLDSDWFFKILVPQFRIRPSSINRTQNCDKRYTALASSLQLQLQPWLLASTSCLGLCYCYAINTSSLGHWSERTKTEMPPLASQGNFSLFSDKSLPGNHHNGWGYETRLMTSHFWDSNPAGLNVWYKRTTFCRVTVCHTGLGQNFVELCTHLIFITSLVLSLSSFSDSPLPTHSSTYPSDQSPTWILYNPNSTSKLLAASAASFDRLVIY